MLLESFLIQRPRTTPLHLHRRLHHRYHRRLRHHHHPHFSRVTGLCLTAALQLVLPHDVLIIVLTYRLAIAVISLTIIPCSEVLITHIVIFPNPVQNFLFDQIIYQIQFTITHIVGKRAIFIVMMLYIVMILMFADTDQTDLICVTNLLYRMLGHETHPKFINPSLKGAVHYPFIILLSGDPYNISR